MRQSINKTLTGAPSISGLTRRLHPFFQDVRFPAVLASLLLSVWCLLLDDVINNDGILYVRTAELIGRGEWQAAAELYKWFFYPLLIAIVSKLTGLGFELSAHALNAGFTALTVIAFISLVRELGGSRSVVMAAAILVLLYPGLNEYRSFVIRDAGYLACYVSAVLLFIKNLKTPRWQLTAGWMAMIAIATLFRIEGLAFLFTLGIFQQFHRSTVPTKIKATVSISLASVALVVAFAWWIFGTFSLSGFGAIGELVQTLWQYLTVNLSTKAAAIAEAIQDERVAGYAPIILIAAVAMIVTVRTLDTLTPLYALLTGHALYRRVVFPLTKARTIWLWLVIAHVAALSAIALVTLFLTGRFPVALSLTLMLAAPFSVAALYEQWCDRGGQGARKNWLFPVLCAALLVTGAEGLYSPTSKSHLKQAGLWLRQNAPAESRLVSNSPVLLFYAERSADPITGSVPDWSQTLEFLRAAKWREYDYLALRVKLPYEQQAAEFRNALGAPVASFTNRKGDAVWIYSKP